MKKITAIILGAVASVAVCSPALSGCSGDGVKFTLSEEGGKHYIVSYSGFSSGYGEYEIPAYYGEGDTYAPVTEIADRGFASTRYTKITVPETVTKIGTAAFSFCYSLETVEFADGIELESFSHGLFGESTALHTVKIPDSVKTIGPYAFSGCTNLSSVEMSSVEIIGFHSFENCTALEGIALPSTLTTIGSLAFYNTGLKEVEIPGSLRDTVTVDDNGNESTVYGLGYASFNSCVNLEKVKIANGVSVIPSGAFGYCLALKEIYIPLSLKEVQGAAYKPNGSFLYGHAFYYCSALTDVYYAGSAEQWKDIKIETKNLSESGITMDNSALFNAIKHYEI